jgi:hypothetical protein
MVAVVVVAGLLGAGVADPAGAAGCPAAPAGPVAVAPAVSPSVGGSR